MDETTARFLELWTRYQPDVRRYVSMLIPRKGDVDDVLQEVALPLLSKFAEYDGQRPFVSWAIQFAYLEVLKWRQKQARCRLVFSDELLAQLDLTITEEAPYLELRRQALDHCLGKLGDRERGLLLVRYAKHGSIQQTAEGTGVSVRKLYHILSKLRIALLKCVQENLSKEDWQHV